MDIAFEPTIREPIRPARPDFDAGADGAAASAHEADPARTFALHGLPKGRTLTLDGPFGQQIGCQRGSLRIRHDGDSTEQLLGAGQTYRCERDGRMQVHALADALLWTSSLGGVAAGLISIRR